jgi:hypothetical protein
VIGPILNALSSIEPSVVKKEGPTISVSIPADHPKADILRRLFVKYQSAAKINGAEVHYSSRSPDAAEQEVLSILRELLEPEAFDRVMEEIREFNDQNRQSLLAGVDPSMLGAMMGPLVGGGLAEKAVRHVQETLKEKR